MTKNKDQHKLNTHKNLVKYKNQHLKHVGNLNWLFIRDKFEEHVEEYGREELIRDVARLRQMNDDLRKECVLEVADNSKLKGEFRMALDIVEGYVINTDKPWCSAYARSEPNYSTQVSRQINQS